MAKAKTPRTSAEKTNGGTVVQPVTTTTSVPNVSEIREVRTTAPDARKNIVPINLDEEIRRRAYELWEEKGREAGHDQEYWLSAEAEIRGRYTGQRQQSA